MVNASGSSGLHDGGEERVGSGTPELAEKWRRWERLHAERSRLAGELPTAASRDPDDDADGPGPAVVPHGPPPGHATSQAPQSPQVASPREPVLDFNPADEPGVPASVAMAERLRAEEMRLEEERRWLEEERQQLSTERSRLEQERAEAARAAAKAASAAAEARRATQNLQGVAQRQQSLPETGRGRRWWRLPWAPRSAPPG